MISSAQIIGSRKTYRPTTLPKLIAIPIRIIDPIISRGSVTTPKYIGFGMAFFDVSDMHAP
jgi:hypothetical protein